MAVPLLNPGDHAVNVEDSCSDIAFLTTPTTSVWYASLSIMGYFNRLFNS